MARAKKDTITRRVRVDRSRTPQEALAATGRRQQYIDVAVVAAMPRGDGEEAEIVFFKVGRLLGDEDLKKEYESRGFVPADPYALAAVNEQYPAFADKHPNGTHWKDADGKWCFAMFDRWVDGRRVHVNHSDDVWYGRSWFAGIRK